MAEDKRSRMGKGRETGEMVNRYTLPPYDMPLPDEKRYILYNQIGPNSKEDNLSKAKVKLCKREDMGWGVSKDGMACARMMLGRRQL